MPRAHYYTGALLAIIIGGMCGVAATQSEGASLLYVSDTIAHSGPATSTSHRATFRIQSALPPGGRIVFTPQSGAFTIPAALSYADLDLATAPTLTGPWTDRSLASSTTSSTDSVAVTTGANGAVTITLGSAAGIPGSSFVRLTIGPAAQHQTNGTYGIVNPATIGSYRIGLHTENASGTILDAGTAMIAIVESVGVSAERLDFIPPVLSNGLPTGAIPYGIIGAELSLNTNEFATCRYATTTGIAYGAMNNSFDQGVTTFHTVTVLGLTASSSYTFYVRCKDTFDNANPDDYPISFSISAQLPPPTGEGGGPAPGGGFGQNFPPGPANPQVTIRGFTSPSARVTVLSDNVVTQEVSASTRGTFEAIIQSVTQGSHVFGVYARDTTGRKSATHTATLTVIQGTQNLIANIIIPPTMSAAQATVAPGTPIVLSGHAAPSSTVEIQLNAQKKGLITDADIVKKFATARLDGTWSYSWETTGFPANTYEIKARASLAGLTTSNFSTILRIGVGREPAGDSCARSDLNGDSRVNLVDFSILLFHWNTTDAIGDINGDGRVNLVDFSVMLFCWTG